MFLLITVAFVLTAWLSCTQKAHSSTMPQYSSEALLALRSRIPQNGRIPTPLMQHLRSLGINKIPTTKRGVRAGRKKTAPNKQPSFALHESKVSFAMLNTTEVIDFVLDNSLDALGICETWLTTDDKAVVGELFTKGFTFKHIPGLSKHGGVGLLFQNELDFQITLAQFSYKSFEFIKGNMTSNSKSIHVVNIYPPPNATSPFHKFMDKFSALLDIHLFAPGPLLISGDFNIHVNATTQQAQSSSDLLVTSFSVQHIIEPTQKKFMGTPWIF